MFVQFLFFSQLISYTTPPYFSKILFVTTVPRPMDPFLNLVYPFTNTIWAILVASVFTVGATSWLVYKSYSTDSLRQYFLLLLREMGLPSIVF